MSVDDVRSSGPGQPLLVVRDLTVSFADRARSPRRVVENLSLTVHPRQTVALVGESGCGKSVTALSITRLLDEPPGHIESGHVHFEDHDLLAMPRSGLHEVRGGAIGMIFQEPTRALNPVITVGEQLTETIRRHHDVARREATRRAIAVMRDVGIAEPERRLGAYPHELSGGLCQRAMIALALAGRPRLLIADEPTTALDVTIQARILDLLDTLKHRPGMGILFITHDLGVVARVADVVCVMYAGRVIEYASVFELFRRPMHPYTRGLLSSVPRLDRRVERLRSVSELVESPAQDAPDRGPPPWRPDSTDAQAYRLIEAAPGHWLAVEAGDERSRAANRPPDLAFRREPAFVADVERTNARAGV